MNDPNAIPMFAETEVTLQDGKTIKLRPGQMDEGVKTLSKEDYRTLSMMQKRKDAEEGLTDEPAKMPPEPKRGRPNKKVGRPQPAQSTPTPTSSVDSRISALEDRLGAILHAIERQNQFMTAPAVPAETTKMQEPVTPFAPLSSAATDGERDGTDDQAEFDEDWDDLSEEATDPHLNDVFDEMELEGDPVIRAIQHRIQKSDPVKTFRRLWVSIVGPSLGVQNWKPETQQAFTNSFKAVVAHPKLIHKTRQLVRTFENGNCVGEEKLARLVTLLAGCVTFYSIINPTGGE